MNNQASMRIYIDFKAPAAYLAWRPTLALLKEFAPTVQWLAINTSQAAVPPASADEDRGATHRRVRAIARRDTHLLYAQLQGVDMRFPEQPGKTDLALSVLEHLTKAEPERQVAFIERAFAHYWVDQGDLNDPQQVDALLTQIDAPLRSASIDIDASLTRMQEQALDDGVVDAPGYVIQQQVFIGREHLPWIRRLLSNGSTAEV